MKPNTEQSNCCQAPVIPYPDYAVCQECKEPCEVEYITPPSDKFAKTNKELKRQLDK
jgi:hypothetical protein